MTPHLRNLIQQKRRLLRWRDTPLSFAVMLEQINKKIEEEKLKQ